ncbi:thiamine phosphate synthase [Kocuria sp. NPDC057446]|uniref:thiamine phosphate synthase n=1 Tax=Kocuria sp. NPDC057446 TaxID=3346137 RepID=UPI0036978BF1
MTHPTRDTSAPAESSLREARTARLLAARLYVCTDARRDRGDLEEFLHAVCAGGADIVQLRDKGVDADEEIAALRLLGRVAAEYGTLVAVNDRADVAALVGADVFHGGQHDLTPAQARQLLGPDVLIGRSTHDLGQARTALEDPDVDYFCTGPVWATPTKPGRPATGLEFVRAVAELTEARLDEGPEVLPVPWFAIGGIDEPRLPQVLEAGARGVVVVRAVTEAPDPRVAAGQLRSLLPA